MPRKHEDLALLWDMLRAANHVQAFVAGRQFQDYLADDMLRLAVERAVEIIGEAARGVSASFRESHPEIPWARIVVQRHRLAHDYSNLDDSLIWTVATVHVPNLVAALTPLVPPAPES